ncbi:MAG: sulfotransferase domain-containing protein [Crocinitomicaceae bacterium]
MKKEERNQIRLIKISLKVVKRLLFALTKVKEYLYYELYMEQFGFKETDVYVVTFPKSGTTLTQMMLYQMISDGSTDFNHIYEVSPWIRNDIFKGLPPNLNLPEPRIIKSHDPYRIFDKRHKGKIIFVIRDGKDALNSLYHQRRSYGLPDLTFDQFLQQSTSNRDSNWFLFNKEWLENKNNFDILYLTYEEITKNKKETIIKLAQYIGIDQSKIDIDRVIEKSGFEFMKEHESKFGEQPPEKKIEMVYDQFIRKGVAGDGQKIFNDQQSAFYDQMFQTHIEPLKNQRKLNTLK